VWTAKRHQGGGQRPGDSRVAVHTKCQREHSTKASKEIHKFIPYFFVFFVFFVLY
jgi:hypothetical protein